jgi:hypothetical protein
MERLQDWYASADYAEALAVRQTARDRRLLFVDGENLSSGLGWPEGGEDLWRERTTEPHHRLVP